MFFLVEKLGTTEQALNTICAWLCELIYPLIAKTFQLFIDVASIRLQLPIETIFRRVTMVLTIVMTFYIIFEFIKYIVQPDTIEDKEKGVGKLGYRIVIVIVLLAFVPDIFTAAWKLQNTIIKNESLSKIIIGKSGVDGTKAGNAFAATMFSTFYKYDDEFWDDEDVGKRLCVEENGSKVECKRIVKWNIDTLTNSGYLPNVNYGINAADTDPVSGQATGAKVALIEFNGGLAVAVGIFIMYILVLYTIDVATRIFQLTYLQIIAPIPIMGYLAPKKDNIFSKWAQQCLVTYLDLFIRLSIIYFVLLLSQVISQSINGGHGVLGVTREETGGLIYVILVMGLLLFAQKAPKLLQELFPKMGVAGGNFGLKAGERVAPLAARALGMTWGATKLGGALLRKGAHAYATNKANGRHSIFTKEGWEERKLDREHRREMRRTNRLGNAAKTDEKAGQEAFNSMKELNEQYSAATKDKRKDLLENGIVQTGFFGGKNKTYREAFDDIRAMEGRAKNLEEKVKNGGMLTKDEKDFLATHKATHQKNKSDLQAEFTAANKKITDDYLKTAEGQKYLRESSAAMSTISNLSTRGIINESRNRINAAQTEKKRILSDSSLTQDEKQKRVAKLDKTISDETRNITEANSLMKSLQTGDKEQIQQQLKEIEQRQQTAQEQVLLDQSHHYQGALGVAASAVAGTAKIMREGAKSTKLEDVRKNVQQGVKNDIADTKAVQKYYDAGGTSWVDRTVQQVEKQIGIPTAYERTMMESRTMEPKIKKFTAQATVTDNFTSAVDAAEDRAKSKIREAKTKVEADDNGKTYIKTGGTGDNEFVVLQGDEKTLADVVKRYDQNVVNAHAHTENEQKRYDDYVAEKREELEDARIMSQARDDLTSDEEKARWDMIDNDDSRKAAAKNASETKARLEQSKDEAARLERKAVSEQTYVEKNAARQNEVSVIKALKNSTGTKPEEKLAEVKAKGYDGALVEKIWDAMERMQLVRSDPDLVTAMQAVLPQDEFNAFMSGEIVYDDPNKTWDIYDKINNAAKSVSSSKKRAKAEQEEIQRALQTSNKTSAQQAANDFNPSGGGK